MKPGSRFFLFADWAKEKIASPRHFVGFIIVVLLWAVWAGSRQFDPFSQLVLNTPTTAAEYAFEILILAAAISAERKGEEVLYKLVSQHEAILTLETKIFEDANRTIQLEQSILHLEQVIAAKLETSASKCRSDEGETDHGRGSSLTADM